MADESNQLRVRLVTPERILFERPRRLSSCRRRTGTWKSCTAMRRCSQNSAPAMCACTAAQGDGGEPIYNVSWGFVEVLPDRVTILANDALKPEEINVNRANEQLDRGHKMWDEAGDSEEAYDEALHVIAEAEAKLATAQEKH